MFTGLIETVGELLELQSSGEGARMVLSIHALHPEVRIGESIAVNGCCLTVSAVTGTALVFDLLHETLKRTNLGILAPAHRVNIERALPADGRIGGHFVQGHIDCTSEILELSRHGDDHRLEVSVPAEFQRFVVFKGSIAIDGISLTIADVGVSSIVAWIIPHTFEVTNLQTRRPGDRVNMEFDVIAKYVARMLDLRSA
jgi:riboflavin synthase